MSSPGLWKKVPGYLADPLGPLAIRWSYLPKLLPWLRRFIQAGATEARVSATAHGLAPLLADSPGLHRRLAEEAGVVELITRQGVLFVFPDRAAFEAEGLYCQSAWTRWPRIARGRWTIRCGWLCPRRRTGAGGGMRPRRPGMPRRRCSGRQPIRAGMRWSPDCAQWARNRLHPTPHHRTLPRHSHSLSPSSVRTVSEQHQCLIGCSNWPKFIGKQEIISN